jgi:DNA-binding beta-propeller fold protein YncE
MGRNTVKKKFYFGVAFIAVLAGLGIGSALLQKRAAVEAAAIEAPQFEVDPLWPKPLPNHWVQGMSVGVSVDAQDHIWIVHHTNTYEPMEIYAAAKPPAAECCIPAPPVLEFDEEGNLIGHWGGPGEGYDWPDSNHGITVDYKGNVWIGGNSRGPDPKGYHDNMVLKMFVDRATDELYVADGYGNHRVIVYDAETGKYKRHWGAYGKKPDDTNLGPYNPDAPPAQQFRNPVHCAELSNEGLLYVCDRPNDRIQVFKKDGTFVKEAFIATRTLGDGSVWDIAFSKDPQQKYIFLADGSNEKIYVLLRDTLEILTSFGDGGRQPGQFYAVHSIAADSKGNLFTTETYRGQRVQKFIYKGLAPVTKKDQGVVWPKSAK